MVRRTTKIRLYNILLLLVIFATTQLYSSILFTKKSPIEESSIRTTSKDSTDGELMKFKMRQQYRKKILEKACKNVDTPTKDTSLWRSTLYSIASHIQVAQKYSLMNCWLQKAGSSAWNNLLATLYDRKELIGKGETWRMQNVLRPTGPEFVRVLGNQSYVRFLHTREPLSRLLSAYNDRILFTGSFSPPSSAAKEYIPLILKQTRPTKKYSTSELYHNNGSFAIFPSFKEFIEYIVENFPKNMNEHWSPAFHHCGVCIVNYTHIVQMETFIDDIKFIMRETGIDDKFASILVSHSYKGKTNTSALMLKSYATLSYSTLQKLITIYKYDSIMFGYNPTEFLKNIYPNASFMID